MINVNGSLFIQIINFLFLIWILNIVLYRPIRNILRQRQEKVQGLQQNIETFTSDVTEKQNTYAAGLKEARTKGMGAKDALVQAAEEEEKKLIDQINQSAQAELASVRERLAQNEAAVRDALMKEVDVFAGQIGAKILGRAV
jgi:F-type H+-transporting ATPase subunit b